MGKWSAVCAFYLIQCTLVFSILLSPIFYCKCFCLMKLNWIYLQTLSFWVHKNIANRNSIQRSDIHISTFYFCSIENDESKVKVNIWMKTVECAALETTMKKHNGDNTIIVWLWIPWLSTEIRNTLMNNKTNFVSSTFRVYCCGYYLLLPFFLVHSFPPISSAF